ncbi:MAG: cation diffusion facilitator family transporter [Pseudomonadota bacterium]
MKEIQSTTGLNPDKIKGLREGQRIALLSTILIFLLALLKAVVGIRFHSPLLVADAFHSGADILINFTSLFGLWMASRKKTNRFPFGLYRAETLACLLMGGLIAVIGIEIFKDGYPKLFRLEPVAQFPLFPVAAAAISSVTALILAMAQKKAGVKINSQALITTARESFFDIFASLVVLAGIVLDYAQIPYVEGAVMIIISILILKLGAETILTSLMILLDANLDFDLQSEIEDKMNSTYGVKGVGEVKIRRSGPFKMVDCVIETSPLLPLYKAHEMADQIERRLYSEYDSIDTVFIHIEPKSSNELSVIIPVRNIDGLHSMLHGHFGRAPYFMIVKLNNGQADIDDFYINQFLDEKGHIGLKVVKTIIQYNIDILFVSRIGEIAFHMLKNNFVDIYQAREGDTVQEVLDAYSRQQLSPITQPTHPIEEATFAMNISEP